MEKETINVINDLCEKFGVVIDWSKENVMPYITELAEKLINFQILKYSISFGISILIIILAVTKLNLIHKDLERCEKTEKNNKTARYYYREAELTDTGFNMTVLSIIALIGAIIVTAYSLIMDLSWICIPEIQVYNYVMNLIG